MLANLNRYKELKQVYLKRGGSIAPLITDFSYEVFSKDFLLKNPDIPKDTERWGEFDKAMQQGSRQTFEEILSEDFRVFSTILDEKIHNRTQFKPSSFIKDVLVSVDALFNNKSNDLPTILGTISRDFSTSIYVSTDVVLDRSIVEHPYVLELELSLPFFNKLIWVHYKENKKADVTDLSQSVSLSVNKVKTLIKVVEQLQEDYNFTEHNIYQLIQYIQMMELDFYNILYDPDKYTEQERKSFSGFDKSSLPIEWRQYLSVIIDDESFHGHFGCTASKALHKSKALRSVWSWIKSWSYNPLFRDYVKLRILYNLAYYDIGCRAEGDLWKTTFGRDHVEVPSPVWEDAFLIKKKLMSKIFHWELAYLFVDKHINELTRMKTYVREQIQEIVAQYIQWFNDCVWMSPITKQRCINKVRHMYIGVAFPEQWVDREIRKEKDIEPESDVVRAFVTNSKKRRRHTLGRLGMPYVRDDWQVNTSFPTYDWNAINSSPQNALFFLANFCLSDMFVRTKYGLLDIIGHEISHSFDPTGREFDMNGIQSSTTWNNREIAEYTLRMEQSIAWTLRRTKTVTPIKSPLHVRLNGSLENRFLPRNMAKEAISDVFAVQVLCKYLFNKYQGKALNQELQEVFTDHAKIFTGLISEKKLEEEMKQAIHIPNIFRSNFALKHCTHFYDMFADRLAPEMMFPVERRMNMWGDTPQYMKMAVSFVEDMRRRAEELTELLPPSISQLLFVGYATAYLFHAVKLHYKSTGNSVKTRFISSHKDSHVASNSSFAVIFAADDDEDRTRMVSLMSDCVVQFLQIPTEDGPDNSSKPWCILYKRNNRLESEYVGDLVEKVFSQADAEVNTANPYLRIMYEIKPES